MKEKLIKRLQELEEEYQKGEQRLQALNSETEKVHNTMLRLSGAIQVLKETLDMEEENHQEAPSNNGISSY